jgi:hypothetical protein
MRENWQHAQFGHRQKHSAMKTINAAEGGRKLVRVFLLEHGAPGSKPNCGVHQGGA